MFFNIESHPSTMTPEDLLRIQPQVLAKLILHKRQRLIESLPKLIETIAKEKHRVEVMTRQFRAKKEELEPKVINLLKERSEIATEIERNPVIKKMSSQDSEACNKIIIRLADRTTSTDEYTNLLINLVKICEQNSRKPLDFRTYESSVKANAALSEIKREYDNSVKLWGEHETNRRKLDSRFKKLNSNLMDSEHAIEFWQQKLTTNFDELLIDAKRVAEGGPSSRQIRRDSRKARKGKGA